jgi:hypothetical protein
MKTIVYVDGLNLYYAALRGTPFKWLDLYALFRDQVLEAGTDVEQVRYYTAPVKGSSSDDPCSPQRAVAAQDSWDPTESSESMGSANDRC